MPPKDTPLGACGSGLCRPIKPAAAQQWAAQVRLHPACSDSAGRARVDLKIAYRLAWIVSLWLMMGSAEAQRLASSVVPATSSETEGSSGAALAASAALYVSPAPNPERNFVHYSLWPRPYVDGGLSLMQGGYFPAAGNVGAGVNVEASRFIAVGAASVDDAHKLDSGTGHDTYLEARGFLRFGRGWYGGGGTQWNKLTTDDYTKQAWRPAFGGGKDVFRNAFSLRTQVLYVFPGTDRLNASQGPEISLWSPSPATNRHLFYYQTIAIYGAHQTSVPGDPGTNVRYVNAFASFTVMYRF